MRPEAEIRDKLHMFELASQCDDVRPDHMLKFKNTILILKWVLGDLEPAPE